MNRSYQLILLSFLLTSAQLTFSQDIVDINLDMRHAVNGVSEFDRTKYMLLHVSVDDNEWPNEQLKEQAIIDNDLYLGRNNGALPWFLSQCEEDPDKPGWPSIGWIQQEGQKRRNAYKTKTEIHNKYESRTSRHMMGGQEVMYPNGDRELGSNGKKWKMTKEGYTPLAEFYANFFKYFYGTGGTDGQPLPTYIEVMNEPFVKANKLATTRENLTEMHNVVAKRIRELNPGAKVGGYSAAHPAYEASNFNHWEKNWKLFIDNAGEEMDFFALHLYDNIQHNQGQYRAGSNAEAILDMVEHYEMIKLGKRKPFCLSEYGNLNTEGKLYTKERDWDNLRSFNTMIMQFLERPDIIEQALPFMILQANWWKPDPNKGQHPDAKYAHRLFRQKKELEGETGDEFVFTELIKFYQQWANVNGTRVDTKASNLDTQVDTYIDGNTAYVIINNMHHEARTVDIALEGMGNANIQSVLMKHLHAENAGVPILEETALTASPDRINIGREATIILEYTFDKALTIPHTSEEKKYFATTYNQPIATNQTITFNINDVDVSSAYGEAMLRIGMGRNHNFSLKPILKINGTDVNVPTNWRGNDQNGRDMFFGVLEIEVPYAILQSNNTITLTYPDNGGRVSSMALQVQAFSREINRSKEKFKLGQNNFSIQSIGETCFNTKNGKINISAVENINYTATLKSNDSSKNFMQDTSFENLEPGNHEVCITVSSEPDFEQCFSINIQAVESLSVSGKTNTAKNIITYNLEGSSSYTVLFNGEAFTTHNNTIILPLQIGKNSIEIKGKKECQGIFKDNILFNAITSYPNPFSTSLTIDLGVEDYASLKIYNTLGSLVYQNTYQTNNNKINLETSFLNKGIYFLSVNTKENSKNIRVIKL